MRGFSISLMALALFPATAAAGTSGAHDESCAGLGQNTTNVTTISTPVTTTETIPNPKYDPTDPSSNEPPTITQTVTTTQTTTVTETVQTADTSTISDCHKQLVNRESVIHLNHHVQDQMVRRLLEQRETASPAGLALNQEESDRRLTGKSGIEVVPTADVAAAPVRNWNAWIDGKYSDISTTEAIGDSDGPLFNGLIGADYKLSDRFTIGLLGTYETSKLETDGAVDQTTKTEGLGGGLYLGLLVGSSVVLSATVTGASLDTDVDAGGVTADIDSARLQLSGGATGYFYFNEAATRFTPLINIAYSEEWQADYVDSGGAAAADQTLQSGVLSAGFQLGHTIPGQGNMSFEPWIGAQLDWTFLDRVKEDGKAAVSADDTVDLRLQGGLNVNLAENAQFALMGEAAGLLLDDSDTYAVDAILSFQF